MAFVAIRVLMIDSQLEHATSVKRNLEQLGNFEVAAFTSTAPAFDYLQQHPQDVALVDFTLPEMEGSDIILRLRAIQPDLAIVASPDTSAVADVVRDLDLQGSITLPVPLRRLQPLLLDAVQQMHDALPYTSQAPPVTGDSETMYIKRMPEDSGASPEPEAIEDEPVFDSESPDTRFQRLAQEEPPIPSLEEGGTVSDLMVGIGDKNLEEVMAILGEHNSGDDEEAGEEESQDDAESPARLVLATSQDDSTPLSLQGLLTSIEKQFPADEEGVRPLPSWLQESERYVQEPDFLPEDLPDIETGQYASETTARTGAQDVDTMPSEIETDRIHPVVRSQPSFPESLPEEEADEEPEPDEDVTEPEGGFELVQEEEPESEGGFEPEQAEAEFEPEEAESVEEAAPEPESDDETLPERIITGLDADDPYIAQLALSLTQVSLELTAEATLLLRDGDIVAYAGTLPYEDVEAIREAAGDDWYKQPQPVLLSFVHLSSSGMDYMLYARSSVSDLKLLLIFGGNMPLHTIRRQSNRLLEAMRAVPEAVEEAEEEVGVETEPEAPPPVEAGPRTAFTYVWLTRDPDDTIDDAAARTLTEELDRQLSAESWAINQLEVHEDFIYLVADVPGEAPPYDVIRDLMERSAAIIREHDPAIDPGTFWASSYLVLTPGRELEVEEFQRFINFARGG